MSEYGNIQRKYIAQKWLVISAGDGLKFNIVKGVKKGVKGSVI